ncbi:MAG: flagellar basal body P-ring formation chaperone FlgA [Desulfovibrionaceae bacterium]|nr:flagellar basal body P-ring formation chaperone FlgA [Desulfovibrionaceae bacterium]
MRAPLRLALLGTIFCLALSQADAVGLSAPTSPSADPYPGLEGLPGVSDQSAAQIPWRVRLKETAIIHGPVLRLGEIAQPAGPLPEKTWQSLAARELWSAPAANSPPLTMTRPRLQQAILETLGQDLAALCLYPPSMTMQRGGRVLEAPELQELAVKTLTPFLSRLPGEGGLSDLRLPPHVFLAGNSQRLELETPSAISPGRLSLRLAVRELDGSVVRRLTGTVFVDCWVTVPCVVQPVNRGDSIYPENITFIRKNLAHLRESPWDGRGGPWQALRPLAAEQPILAGDLGHTPTIKKGAIVKLIFESPGVRLIATAEAMGDGVRGETILVRNINSKRQVYASILNGETVMARQSAPRAGLERISSPGAGEDPS